MWRGEKWHRLIREAERENLQDVRRAYPHAGAVTVESGKIVLDRGEQDYLDTLTMLVESYDRDHFEIDPKQCDPVTMLKYLMEESGMTQADLGRLLGNRALASVALNGRRQLSKSHIRKLANHFKLSPALFLARE